MASLTLPVRQPASSCSEPLPGSVLIAPIEVSDVDLPAEYRILLYEQTIKELKIKRPEDSILRTGDRSSGPGRAALSLDITVTGFKKGNRALRAATGPLGLFLGTTSLTFEVSLLDAHNKTVFQGTDQEEQPDRFGKPRTGGHDREERSKAYR